MEPLRANSARAGAGGRLARLLPAACCLLAAAGCQNGRQLQTDLYHRELRQQEDEIYRLEDYVEEYQAIVCSQREEIAGLKRQLASPRTSATSEPSRPRILEPEAAGPTLADPAIEPKPRDKAAPEIEVDELIKTPDASDAPEAPPFKPSAAAAKEEALDAAPAFEGAQVELGPSTRLVTLTVEEPAPFRPAAIEASRPLLAEPTNDPPNPYPTATNSPLRATTEPDPEAVVDASLTLQPRSLPDGSLTAHLAGGLADFRGTASLMLTDPSLNGRHKRLARWDFSSDEVAALLASNPGSLELLVAIPETLPTERPLRLWVRLVDEAGSRRLQAADVAFTGSPLQLATAVRRLPVTNDSPPQVAESSPAAWRPARDRRINDGAVLRASYEMEVR